MLRAPSDETRREYPGGEAPNDPSTPQDTTTPETPSGSGGSEPPPPDAGDESPDPSFPVPPVPPPPTPGPTFTLAGGGGGGAASFARPGTEAAKPFRSQMFSTNRGTAQAARFGAGSPVTGGTTPFLPAGLDGGGDAASGAPGDEELQRIMALLRGGGAVA